MIKIFDKKIDLPKFLKKTIADIHARFSEKIYSILFVNILLVFLQYIYIRIRFSFINSEIPFWYSKIWGDSQLVDRNLLYLIPLISLAITLLGAVFFIPVKHFYIKHALTLIGIATISANLLLSFSLVRIIFIASSPFQPVIDPLYLDLLLPGILSFIAMMLVLPRFIEYAKKIDLVTNPALHDHPSMVLKAPSARGGGFIYGMLFLFLGIVFVGIPQNMGPFFISMFLISILGILDDYQNTHPESKMRFFESPLLRLVSQFLIVSIFTFFGTRFMSITSPFGGLFLFESGLLSSLVTTLWIVWVINVMSWSNGIDGQYSGIVGIASILIALLALRFEPLELMHKKVAILGAISAGLSLGFIKFNWHPSKIMWGFGAISAGLVLSSLSIFSQSKIITSVLIILIPFLDAVVIVIKRIMNGKNPLKGDRGHLHHMLMNRGWGVNKIAIFYWLTTAIFGSIGYLSADLDPWRMGLIVVGVVAFVIVLLNFRVRDKT